MPERMNESEILRVTVPPEREALVREYCEAFGYRIIGEEHPEHGDMEFIFHPEDPKRPKDERYQKASQVFEKIKEIDGKVRVYYLKRVVLVGMAGAALIGLSFAALHYHQQVLFAILLMLGIFGCTITLYLRPLFTKYGMKKYGAEEQELLAELRKLLEEAASDSDGKGGNPA